MLPEKYTYLDGTHAKLQELERELKHRALVKTCAWVARKPESAPLRAAGTPRWLVIQAG